MYQDIHIDPQIRNWVLFPIMFVMVLVGVLRHYVSLLMQSTPQPNLSTLKEAQSILRSKMLQLNCHLIQNSSFQSRKYYLITSFKAKKYHALPESKGAPNPLDPAQMDGMMQGMKVQMMQMIPQTIVMSWINFFFSGFVVCRLPFPLTLRFKEMLQRDVMTRDLDATWVSALSWYFLNLFGLSNLFTFILGNGNAADGSRDMSMIVPPTTHQPQDMNKVFMGECDLLNIVKHEFSLDGIEERLLAKYEMSVDSLDRIETQPLTHTPSKKSKEARYLKRVGEKGYAKK